jgi:uncharacterized protein YcbK (DUF882 family)
MDWRQYPNFRLEEFRCRYTGECEMHPDHMRRLQQLRGVFGKPMVVTSGYRSKRHPIEAAKATPGEHTHGRATDVAVQGTDALRLVHLALMAGFTRIGVNQKGTGRFIHLGDSPDFPSTIWSY